jgi:hypothetical protein
LWLAACALANPAAFAPLAVPAKFAVRNALLMVAAATVALVVRSRSGLAALRPRASGCSKNIPAGAAATALQKSAVLVRPRCASTSCCACENVAKSAVTGASNWVLNASKVGMKPALLGSSTSSNMAAGTRGVLVQSQ